MTRSSCGVATAVAAIAVSISSPAASQEEKEQRFGNVHFQTSCNDTAQRRFDRGMRYQHSFWYRQSKEIFEDVLKADPECSIAYWGIAQSLLANPFNPTPPKNLQEGLAAIQKAKQTGAKTQRENDLIAAIEAYYTDFDKVNQRVRAQSYLKAMEQVANRYPDDDEVQIYYALALNIAAAPSDKTYVNQLKAAAILEPLAKRRPQHPGVAHYLIHTYDYPALAAKGFDAALRYAKIAEAAPHAQHMPSHIFTRIGYWKESVDSNRNAAKLAKAGNEADDELHASDYMVYAYLQLARDRDAREVIEAMPAITGYNPDRNTGPFALAASPARYVVERGDWSRAAQLELRPSRFGYVDAMTFFARALGAARSGNAEAAKADIAKLGELRDKLREDKDAYWSEQVDIQAQVATAWSLHTAGAHADALKTMAAAADAEDKTEKATVTPGPLAPARELFGEMLLENGQAKEALAAFETAMVKEPNRYRGLAGAAKAAELLGDKAKAKAYNERLVTLADGSDRPELAAAKQFLRKN
jgi:Tfp pilus assembly protein PilF